MSQPVFRPDHTQFHSEFIRAGLQDHIVGGLVHLEGESWRIVFLRSGAVNVVQAEDTAWVGAPALIWQPIRPDIRIKVRAGSLGAHLLLGDQGLSNAIGRKPEAAELRVMADQSVQMPLDGQKQVETDVARAFDVILREGRQGDPGAETIIEAQVRVLLVHLWRYVTRSDQLAQTNATASQVLQRFRQMLEVHFRERWGVRRYATELGVSTDRLHDICSRSLRKTPLRLIHERTIYEARSLLLRSNRTVDQIAHFLGFRSAGQFNKLFKHVVGVPPGEFRRNHRLLQIPEDNSEALTFADWP